MAVLDSCRFCVEGVTGQDVWPINILHDLTRLFVERKFVTGTLLLTIETQRLMLSRTEAISNQFCVQQKEPRQISSCIFSTYQRWLPTGTLQTIISSVEPDFQRQNLNIPSIIHLCKRDNHH